jgi:hypothetical protein
MLLKPSHIIFCLLFFTIFITCKKNDNAKISEIDNLKSQTEVQNLIRKNFKDLSKYEVKKIQDFKRNDFVCEANVKLADELGVNESFYRTDFDKNGFTDLLIIGDDFSCYGGMDESCSFRPIVLLNFGNEKYKIVNISQNFDDYYTPKIVSKNGQNLLEIYRTRIKDWENKITYKNPQKQILAYKFDDFIEYNSNNQNYIPIQKIEFSTSGCYGTCPVFDLEINQNQDAKFIAKQFNFNKELETWSDKNEGTFQTKIKDKDFNTLIKLLAYIDFPQLENNYSVNWTDDQTVELKIIYSSGKIKTISDYGASGSYGLKKVYKLLFDLRQNQNWKKIDEK